MLMFTSSLPVKLQIIFVNEIFCVAQIILIVSYIMFQSLSLSFDEILNYSLSISAFDCYSSV